MRQGYDVLNDPVFMDLTSDMGLIRLISLMLRLKPQGLFFGGVPCESFGWMACPTHNRGAVQPWGELKRPFVYRGNVLATRFCLLALLAVLRGCVWALENPERSMISNLPPIQFLLQCELHPLMVKWFDAQLTQVI